MSERIMPVRCGSTSLHVRNESEGVIMKLYVGVTDKNWYEQLKREAVDEVNFWNPGAAPFKALQENELFLFKLHYPENYIVGGGFFVRYTQLPPFLAWEAFERKNGTASYDELISRIEKYRGRNRMSETAQIGCTILTEPFWFDEADWLPVPEWSKSIVKGKTFSTDTEVGERLYNDVIDRISRSTRAPEATETITEENRYAESLTRHRLGQGAFRITVTDAYQRRCAITGEKTLPVLEAAHIKPYADNGPHLVTNGLLLKSDIHTLFDKGYITITKDYKIEVSHRLHDDYGNGKDYYKYQGQRILILPDQVYQRPDSRFVEWHNDHIYLG